MGTLKVKVDGEWIAVGGGGSTVPSADAGNDLITGTDQLVYFDHDTKYRDHVPNFPDAASRNLAIPMPFNGQRCRVGANTNEWCAVTNQWFLDPYWSEYVRIAGQTAAAAQWAWTNTLSIPNAPAGVYKATFTGVWWFPSGGNVYANLCLGAAQTGQNQQVSGAPGGFLLPFTITMSASHAGGLLDTALQFGYGSQQVGLDAATSHLRVERLGPGASARTNATQLVDSTNPFLDRDPSLNDPPPEWGGVNPEEE